MKIQRVQPYQALISGYKYQERTLFVCDTSIISFDAILPDASVTMETEFWFQKDDSSNILGIVTQFGQTINGVERISVYGSYQSVLIVSDGENYRMLAGYVPELPITLPVGNWIWQEGTDGNFYLYYNNGTKDNPEWIRKQKITPR